MFGIKKSNKHNTVIANAKAPADAPKTDNLDDEITEEFKTVDRAVVDAEKERLRQEAEEALNKYLSDSLKEYVEHGKTIVEKINKVNAYSQKMRQKCFDLCAQSYAEVNALNGQIKELIDKKRGYVEKVKTGEMTKIEFMRLGKEIDAQTDGIKVKLREKQTECDGVVAVKDAVFEYCFRLEKILFDILDTVKTADDIGIAYAALCQNVPDSLLSTVDILRYPLDVYKNRTVKKNQAAMARLDRLAEAAATFKDKLSFYITEQARLAEERRREEEERQRQLEREKEEKQKQLEREADDYFAAFTADAEQAEE